MTRLLHGLHAFIYTLLAFPRAWRFMWHHRLWEGLRQYSWAARLLVAVGIVIGLYMLDKTLSFVGSHPDHVAQSLFSTTDSLFIAFWNDAIESCSDGVMKWIILVLLELVIYHFMRRTLAIILVKEHEDQHTFKPFLAAQKRMVIISFQALVLEGLIIGIGGVLIPWWLHGLFSTLISSAFLGFVIADNYNEQFGLTITQSWRNIFRNYIGISLGLGVPLFLMLQVPLLGTVLGPLVTSVTAAIVLRELSDLHLIGYQLSDKEQQKLDKEAAREARKLARKNKRRGLVSS